MARNYIETGNPFNLARPPAFFLTDLERYDPEIVIFPSLEESVYRVARRKKLSALVFEQVKLAHQMLSRRPDTQVFAQHRLVGIGSLFPSLYTHWGPHLVKELSERDSYDKHDAKAATVEDIAAAYTKHVDDLDAQDEIRTVRQLREQDEGVEDRAKVGYNHVQYAEGHRIFLNSGHRVLVSASEAARLSQGGAEATT